MQFSVIIFIHTKVFLADGSLSTSAGLKNDFLWLPGDSGGEKLLVDVAEPVEAKDSKLLELSSSNARGASWVSVKRERERGYHKPENDDMMFTYL